MYVYNAGATYFESSLSFGRKSADTAQVDRLRDGHDGIHLMNLKIPFFTCLIIKMKVSKHVKICVIVLTAHLLSPA